MSKLQVILITILSAILFQVASALAVFSADDLTDVRRWFVGVLVGIANAVGVAIVALYTTGGISLPRPPNGGAAGGSSGSGGGSPGGGGGGGLAIVWDAVRVLGIEPSPGDHRRHGQQATPRNPP